MKHEKYQDMITIGFNRAKDSDRELYSKLVDYCKKNNINRNAYLKNLLQKGIEKQIETTKN